MIISRRFRISTQIFSTFKRRPEWSKKGKKSSFSAITKNLRKKIFLQMHSSRQNQECWQKNSISKVFPSPRSGVSWKKNPRFFPDGQMSARVLKVVNGPQNILQPFILQKSAVVACPLYVAKQLACINRNDCKHTKTVLE